MVSTKGDNTPRAPSLISAGPLVPLQLSGPLLAIHSRSSACIKLSIGISPHCTASIGLWVVLSVSVWGRIKLVNVEKFSQFHGPFLFFIVFFYSLSCFSFSFCVVFFSHCHHILLVSS